MGTGIGVVSLRGDTIGVCPEDGCGGLRNPENKVAIQSECFSKPIYAIKTFFSTCDH